MRIVVLDYAGHIPQADLARNLAKQGHKVLHLYCSDYISGRGAVERESNDPNNLDFYAISIDKNFNRYNPFERLLHESKISALFWEKIELFNADQTIISNVPLFAMIRLSKKMKSKESPYLYWWQDVYSISIGNSLNKFGVLSWPIRKYLISIEKKILKYANRVVAISPNFEKIYFEWKLNINKFYVYPNWTPITLFKVEKKLYSSKRKNIVVYAGTLGLKHRPQLLLCLADDRKFKKLGTTLIIVSEGYGRNFLNKKENRRKNIELMDFLPIDELAQLFSDASVLLAVLEPKFSEYCVPSKIMSYLSAGKPIVASINQSNAAAIILRDSGAGIVISPDSLPSDFCEAVTSILIDKNKQLTMSDASLKYSRENFNGSKAAKFFIKLLV